ncbi:MAG: Ax21 family protein [Aquimonas sp.]|nr:Ax21 family protein [Aquimonas sp.]
MKRSLISLALLAALPFAASASELSYNYVEGGYSRISPGFSTDGWRIGGSVAINPSFHVFGGFQSLESSFVDFDAVNLGLGYNHALGLGTDLVSRVSYNRYESSASGLGLSLDENSWVGEVGVRSQLASRFEGYVFAGYERPTSGSGDFYGRIGAQFNFTPRFGLVADVKATEDVREYFIGPRFSF